MRVSQETHESTNIDVDDNNNIKMPTTLEKYYLDYTIIKIIPPSVFYDASNTSQHEYECHRVTPN